jgi:choline dehydrogenase-like flavoprotein
MNVDGTALEYVIVGAGPAGCVLASPRPPGPAGQGGGFRPSNFIPMPTTCNLNAPCMMIGETAARLVLGPP